MSFSKIVIKIILFTFVISVGVSCENDTKKTGKHAYILTQKLFEEYEGTKEYKKRLASTELKQKKLLDSLLLTIKMMSSNVAKNAPELLFKKEQYNSLYEQINVKNEQEIQQYNDQLWKQINQYIEEYGKKKEYSFIHGANGSGNLMFADTTYNITSDVILFINEKYAGK